VGSIPTRTSNFEEIIMAFLADVHSAKKALRDELVSALDNERRAERLADAIEKLIDEKLLDLENKLTQSGDWSPDY
jgi:hypothetical protein